uniref:7TM_GPCR_Srx domain-containing protein n=2 Tax=Bursaphelenchus xylophilus TaxID=6326 RepID=A0A1I7S9G1_BURXY
MLSDLPNVLIMTFFWIPMSYFDLSTSIANRSAILNSTSAVSTSVAFTSSNFALNTQLLIVITRFVGVFYTFYFDQVFRSRYVVLMLVVAGIMALNQHAIGSLYLRRSVHFDPLTFGFHYVPFDGTIDNQAHNTSYIISLVHFWCLILACVVLALVTMIKLHMVNNVHHKGPGIHKKVKRRRRQAEWKLLVVSISTPLIMSVQAIVAATSYLLFSFPPGMIVLFVFNWVFELITVQSFA